MIAQTDTTKWTILKTLELNSDPHKLSQTIENYNPHYYDPENGTDPYWDQNDKENLQFRKDNYPPMDDEDDLVNEDNKLSQPLSNFAAKLRQEYFRGNSGVPKRKTAPRQKQPAR